MNNYPFNDPANIKEILDPFLRKKTRYQGVLIKIKDNWKSIMNTYHEHTDPIQIKDNTLIIKVNSAPLFQELSSFKSNEIQQSLKTLLNRDISVKFTLT